MLKTIKICHIAFYFLFFPLIAFGQTMLFQESFDDANFASRGWYDAANGGGAINTSVHIPGSTASFECHWLSGGTHCDGGTPQRHKFTPSNSVYISFWLKHSSSWTGKGTHVFYLLTTEDGDYSALAFDHLDAYVNDGTLQPYALDLELQDGANIVQNSINTNLTQLTENRASQGCNGLIENTQDFVSCYILGSSYTNMRNWKSPNAFTTSAGPYYMQDWHFVEAYFQLNTIDASGKGLADGVLQLWIDGTLQVSKSTVNFRTGAHPTMQFNQLILAPYMGASPADQTIWIDNLAVATSRPVTVSSAPSPPTSLTVQ